MLLWKSVTISTLVGTLGSHTSATSTESEGLITDGLTLLGREGVNGTTILSWYGRGNVTSKETSNINETALLATTLNERAKCGQNRILCHNKSTATRDSCNELHDILKAKQHKRISLTPMAVLCGPDRGHGPCCFTWGQDYSISLRFGQVIPAAEDGMRQCKGDRIAVFMDSVDLGAGCTIQCISGEKGRVCHQDMPRGPT